MKLKNGESVSCKCGAVRVRRTDELCTWSDTKTSTPFDTFIDGTACRCFPRMALAIEYLQGRHHCDFSKMKDRIV